MKFSSMSVELSISSIFQMKYQTTSQTKCTTLYCASFTTAASIQRNRSLNSSKEQVAAQISRFEGQPYGKNVDSPYPMQYIPSQQDSPVFSNNNNQNPYNFSQNAFYKINPLFTYQMMLNQRLKHNQLDNSVKHGADFNSMGQQQPQQFRVNSFQQEVNNSSLNYIKIAIN